MAISGEDIKKKILLRLGNYSFVDTETEYLLDMYIDSVTMDIAGTRWYRDLLKTEYLDADSDGIFSVAGNIIPFLTFAYGTENERHSWQRLTPVDYEYFENWQSRVYRGVNLTGGGGITGGIRRRYSIIPEGDPDTTTMKLLELQDTVPIKLIYYPIRPAVSDFPDYFEPLITNKVIELYTIDRQDSSKDRYVQLLAKRTEDLDKRIKKQANTIEVNKYGPSVRNQKTQDWIMSESNDIGYWLT